MSKTCAFPVPGPINSAQATAWAPGCGAGSIRASFQRRNRGLNHCQQLSGHRRIEYRTTCGVRWSPTVGARTLTVRFHATRCQTCPTRRESHVRRLCDFSRCTAHMTPPRVRLHASSILIEDRTLSDTLRCGVVCWRCNRCTMKNGHEQFGSMTRNIASQHARKAGKTLEMRSLQRVRHGLKIFLTAE